MSIEPLGESVGAEQCLEQAALTLSDQAAEAQDLTLPDLDADAAQRRASQAATQRAALCPWNEACRERTIRQLPARSSAGPPHPPRRPVSAIDTSAPFLSIATRLQKRTISSQRCEMKRTIAPVCAGPQPLGKPRDFACRRAPKSLRRAGARGDCAQRRARSPASAAGRAADRRRCAPGSMSRRWRARISFAVCAGAARDDAAPGALSARR